MGGNTVNASTMMISSDSDGKSPVGGCVPVGTEAFGPLRVADP